MTAVEVRRGLVHALKLDFIYLTDSRDVQRKQLPKDEEIKPLVGPLRHTRYSERSVLDCCSLRCFDSVNGSEAIIPRQDPRYRQLVGKFASDFDSVYSPAHRRSSGKSGPARE